MVSDIIYNNTSTQCEQSSEYDAPNTMAAVLSALRVLMVWSQSYGVDLESRFANRLFLNEQEVESLCRHAQTKASTPEDKKQNVIRVTRRQEASRA